MSTPKGTRCRKIGSEAKGCVHVYSDAEQLVIQLRQATPTEDDLLAPSFKVAVTLTTSEALELAGELLQAAGLRIRRQRKGDDP